MEFLLFLTARENEILELINKAGFSLEENTPLCLMGKRYVGFVKRRQKAVVICTENIKEFNGYSINKTRGFNDRTAISIRKAIRHEATHVAQYCNKSKPLGVISSKKRVHEWYKKAAIEGSTRVGDTIREKEHEAYYMEDRPKEVISILKKYCL